MISLANWTRKWVSCSKDKQSRAASRKTAEYIISVPPRSGRHQCWTARTTGQKIWNKSENRNKKEERVAETERECVSVSMCVCERKRDVPHSARGQWELIFLLSYPLASLAVLAVRWWIHCFLKFVCNHRLCALFSYLLGPCSLFFSSLFHHPDCLFLSFISPSPSPSLLFFFIFFSSS